MTNSYIICVRRVRSKIPRQPFGVALSDGEMQGNLPPADAPPPPIAIVKDSKLPTCSLGGMSYLPSSRRTSILHQVSLRLRISMPIKQNRDMNPNGNRPKQWKIANIVGRQECRRIRDVSDHGD